MVLEAVDKVDDFKAGKFKPRVLDYSDPTVEGSFNDNIKPKDASRHISWEEDDTETVVRKARASDSRPGVRANLKHNGKEKPYFMYGVNKITHVEDVFSKWQPGDVMGYHGQDI